MPQDLSIVKAEPLTVTASTPSGSERTRQDTNVIGIDHNKIVQGIANWASTLPPQWQKPAAMIATLPADALASLVEMFSAPETIATVGAKPAMAAMDTVGDVASAMAQKVAATGRVVAPIAKAAGRELVKGAAGYRATKVWDAVQAAREAAQTAAPAASEGAAASLPGPETLSPLELTRSLKAGGVPNPTVVSISPQMIRNQLGIAARRAGVSLTDDVETAATALMQQGTPAAEALTQALKTGSKAVLTAGESKLVAAMVRRGASDAEVQAAVKAARAFNAKFNLSTPTPADTRFPKGWGGTRPLGALEP